MVYLEPTIKPIQRPVRVQFLHTHTHTHTHTHKHIVIYHQAKCLSTLCVYRCIQGVPAFWSLLEPNDLRQVTFKFEDIEDLMTDPE